MYRKKEREEGRGENGRVKVFIGAIYENS